MFDFSEGLVVPEELGLGLGFGLGLGSGLRSGLELELELELGLKYLIHSCVIRYGRSSGRFQVIS
jgi:hypothetical protein